MLEWLDARDPRDHPAVAERAAARWRAGGLVAFPTETVYGLGADARSARAVGRIFAAKGRPADHPLIVHLADAAALGEWAADVPDVAWRLARAFWPGPLTLVLRRHRAVPPEVTGGQPTVAVRVPSHPVAQALLRAFGDGVAAPSANRFGRVSPTEARHVFDDLGHVADLCIVDGGPCDVGLESSIVDVSAGRAWLRRSGALARSAIEAVAGMALSAPDDRAGAAPDEAPPRVPGSLARHYAPATPTLAVDLGAGDAAADDVAVLARRPPPPRRSGPWFALPDDPRGAARLLYRALRELDAAGARVIWLEPVPIAPAWSAIADRLARAVAPEERPGGAAAAAPAATEEETP